MSYNQNETPYNSSGSSTNEDFQPQFEVLAINYELSHNLIPAFTPNLEPLLLGLDSVTNQIHANAVDAASKVAQEKLSKKFIEMAHTTAYQNSLIFSFSQDNKIYASASDQQNSFTKSMISIEKKNIASIIKALTTITNDDQWFKQFNLALAALQTIKDYNFKTNDKLSNVPEEATTLANALITRLNLSAEHTALVKSDLEKPVVDSIDFLFNLGQMISATNQKISRHSAYCL